MSCMLGVSGNEFEVDSFLAKSGLKDFNLFYANDLVVPTKSNGKKHERNGFTAIVSNADFNDYKRQVTDAIAYLKENRDGLKLLKNTKGIEFAIIDFGVEFPDDIAFLKSFYLDTELIKLCGELGLSIELSVYPESSKD